MLYFVVHMKAQLFFIISPLYANHKNSNFRAHAAPNKLFMQICFQYLIPNRWEDAKLQSKNLKNAFDRSSPQHQQKSIKQAAVRVWWRCGKEFTSFFIHTNFWQKITLISCKHKKITILNTKFPSMLFWCVFCAYCLSTWIEMTPQITI